jgi:hypothetical protein
MGRRRVKLLIGVAGLVAIASTASWLLRREGVRSHIATPHPATAKGVTSPPGPLIDRGDASKKEAPRLRAISAELAAAKDSGAAGQRLAELRQALADAPAREAAEAIRKFLDSKTDASSGQGFKLNAVGQLEEAPTLRTFLLDELARLDPVAAAEYAKTVLASMDSPDEWAVALRSLARGDPSSAGRALLEQKTGELLRHAEWQQNPSVGYLEAFDVAVYLGGTGLLPALSDLVRRQDNPALAHAAFLALDRLVINDPAAMLAALEADPNLMQGRELTRADYFARADVRDPQQRQVLEKYLLEPSLNSAELEQFAGVFPNANSMISHNLLTQPATPEATTLRSRDAESLRVLEEWLADPRFEKVRPELEKAKSRLQEFVRQAGGR